MAISHLIFSCIYFQVRHYKVPGNIKHLINFSKVPKINFDTEAGQVKEIFGRGSGPGGQNVNKANNAVTLIHLETKVFVKSHESRSLVKNREIAKAKLIDKLDLHLNGEESIEAQVKKIEKERKEIRKEAAKLKREEKARLKLTGVSKDAEEIKSGPKNTRVNPSAIGHSYT